MTNDAQRWINRWNDYNLWNSRVNISAHSTFLFLAFFPELSGTVSHIDCNHPIDIRFQDDSSVIVNYDQDVKWTEN